MSIFEIPSLFIVSVNAIVCPFQGHCMLNLKGIKLLHFEQNTS